MRGKLKKTILIVLSITFLMGVTVTSALASVTPVFTGALEVELEGNRKGEVTGSTELNLAMHIDARGSNRAYVELGVHPGKRTLGSGAHPWGDWSPRISLAWIEHDAPLYHNGEKAKFRIGVAPVTVSPNIGKLDAFQGLRVSDVRLFGIDAMLLYGWSAATSAHPQDTVFGGSASAWIFDTDVSALAIRSKVQETTFWELQLKRRLTPDIEAEALVFSDGFTQPYFYTVRAYVGDATDLTVTLYDYGQFDTRRYHAVGENYLHYQYSNKYSGLQGALSGHHFGVDWEVGYHTWDDFSIRHQVPSIELSGNVGPLRATYELEYDQAVKQQLKNALSLSTFVDASQWMQNVKLGLAYDLAAADDKLVLSSEYSAPNSVTYKLQHGSDSGITWSINTKLSF